MNISKSQSDVLAVMPCDALGLMSVFLKGALGENVVLVKIHIGDHLALCRVYHANQLKRIHKSFFFFNFLELKRNLAVVFLHWRTKLHQVRPDQTLFVKTTDQFLINRKTLRFSEQEIVFNTEFISVP